MSEIFTVDEKNNCIYQHGEETMIFSWTEFVTKVYSIIKNAPENAPQVLMDIFGDISDIKDSIIEYIIHGVVPMDKLITDEVYGNIVENLTQKQKNLLLEDMAKLNLKTKINDAVEELITFSLLHGVNIESLTRCTNVPDAIMVMSEKITNFPKSKISAMNLIFDQIHLIETTQLLHDCYERLKFSIPRIVEIKHDLDEKGLDEKGLDEKGLDGKVDEVDDMYEAKLDTVSDTHEVNLYETHEVNLYEVDGKVDDELSMYDTTSNEEKYISVEYIKQFPSDKVAELFQELLDKTNIPVQYLFRLNDTYQDIIQEILQCPNMNDKLRNTWIDYLLLYVKGFDENTHQEALKGLLDNPENNIPAIEKFLGMSDRTVVTLNTVSNFFINCEDLDGKLETFKNHADVYVLAGDIWPINDDENRRELEKILKHFTTLANRVVYVPGDLEMCSKNFHLLPEICENTGVRYLYHQTVQIYGFTFAGTPMNQLRNYVQDMKSSLYVDDVLKFAECVNFIKNTLKTFNKVIMCSAYDPLNILSSDTHSILHLLDSKRIKLWVCGSYEVTINTGGIRLVGNSDANAKFENLFI